MKFKIDIKDKIYYNTNDISAGYLNIFYDLEDDVICIEYRDYFTSSRFFNKIEDIKFNDFCFHGHKNQYNSNIYIKLPKITESFKKLVEKRLCYDIKKHIHTELKKKEDLFKLRFSEQLRKEKLERICCTTKQMI